MMSHIVTSSCTHLFWLRMKSDHTRHLTSEKIFCIYMSVNPQDSLLKAYRGTTDDIAHSSNQSRGTFRRYCNLLKRQILNPWNSSGCFISTFKHILPPYCIVCFVIFSVRIGIHYSALADNGSSGGEECAIRRKNIPTAPPDCCL